MKEIRFGIIGYGIQGKLYASLLSGRELMGAFSIERPANCRLTAISSRSDRAGAEYADDADVSVFTDWKELIDSGACDAVVVTVPHFFHPEITVYGLEHGVHVLCEKPAAIRASEVQNMIKVSDEHPEVAFGLVLNQRTNPVFQKVKEVLNSGALGEIRRSNWIINSWWRPDSYYRSSPWRGSWNGEGGGVLVNQAPHQLDLWCWLCGMPKALYAVCKEGSHRNISVENDVTIVTEYENGSTGCFITCTHDPLGTNRLELDCSGGKVVIEDNSKAVFYYFQKEEQEWNAALDSAKLMGMLRQDPSSLYRKEEFSKSLAFGQEYRIIFENFAEHICNGTPLIAPGAEGLHSVRIANAAILSSAQKKQLTFPCDEDEFDEYLSKRMEQELQSPDSP